MIITAALFKLRDQLHDAQRGTLAHPQAADVAMETRGVPVADYPYLNCGIGQAPRQKQLSVLIFFFLLRNEHQLFTKAWATCC